MNYLNCTRSFIQKILEKPLGFEWSVQGLGMMRLYVKRPDLRLHIWDSSLRVPSVSPLHTHPWNFSSTVIAGIMFNRRFLEFKTRIETTLKTDSFNRVEITCGESACTHGDPGEVFLYEGEIEKYVQGSDYFQSFDEIHVSMPEDGTVTLVERQLPPSNSPDKAFIFWRGKGDWVNAKPRQATDEEITGVTRRALTTWF